MAICPFAKQELIPAGPNDPPIEPVGAIFHIAVSGAESLHDYFDGPSNGIESHFYIQWDGDIIQYRDTGYEADANYKANSWLDKSGKRVGMVSFEFQGFGDGKYTKAQLSSAKKLIAWLHTTHRYFRPISASGPYSGGIGYHSQYVQWSPVVKSCPGPNRIPQIKAEIYPWLTTLRVSPEKAASLKILNKAIRQARRKHRRRRLNVLTKIKLLWRSIR